MSLLFITARMTIEANLNTNTLYKSSSPKFNRYWKEIAFSIWINEPIILNSMETNLVLGELLHCIDNRNSKSEKLWKKLQWQWFKIILDPSKYWSKYDGRTKQITLWVKDHNNASAADYFHSANLSPNVDERILIWIMFVHECSHHIFHECFNQPEMEELKRIVYSHTRSNKALTKNTRSYNWDGIKIKEDITELIRMYVMNPEFLKLHLKFLNTTWSSYAQNKYNLHRIGHQDEYRIYNLIEKIVNNYLSN